jgi:hypothetical protein
MDEYGPAQTTTALGAFALAEVPATGLTAQDFAGGGYFEPLGHGFFRFDTFGTSHKFSLLSKRTRNIGSRAIGRKR